MNNLAVFAMLPPFYDKPPHKDIKWYLKRIEEEFSIKIKKYKYLKWAFDHDVFLINDETVVRFPRTEIARNNFKREIYFLEFLKDKIKIHIPKYSYISKSNDFAGYDLIPGKILTSSVFKNLSRSNKEKIIIQLTGFINDFHKISLADFKKFKPKERDEFGEVEKKIEIELEEKLFPRLSRQEVEGIKNFYQESKRFLSTIPNVCATHGDLYAYNVLWDKNKSEVGIIDFSDVLIGDPAKDFEVFYDYGEEYAETAYKKYQGSKDNEFLKRAEIYYKAHAIYTLLSSLLGAQISFDYAYSRFQQRFSL